jgi:hypothetical protein
VATCNLQLRKGGYEIPTIDIQERGKKQAPNRIDRSERIGLDLLARDNEGGN